MEEQNKKMESEQEQSKKFQDMVGGIKMPELAVPANKEAEYLEEISKLKDSYLRAVADSENLRKRTEKQLEDGMKFATTNFARDLTSAIENLYRLLDNFPGDIEDSRMKTLHDGIELTQREFINAFEKNGLKRVYPAGEVFDHNLHQAVAQIPNSELAEGIVLQVVKAGYILHDRLIEPAMVTVSKSAE